MYNRYIPQPDGSYRRSRMPDQSPRQGHRPSPPKEKPKEPEHPPEPPHAQKQPDKSGGLGFLRQLLPKDFDAGDLIVVLLLLLMAGDSTEDQNTALLTLALYFFYVGQENTVIPRTAQQSVGIRTYAVSLKRRSTLYRRKRIATGLRPSQ